MKKLMLLLAVFALLASGCALTPPQLEQFMFAGGSAMTRNYTYNYPGGTNVKYTNTNLVGEMGYFLQPNIAFGGMIDYDTTKIHSSGSTTTTSSTGLGPAAWMTFPGSVEGPYLPYVSGYLGFNSYEVSPGLSSSGETLRLAVGAWSFCGANGEYAVKAELYWRYTTFSDSSINSYDEIGLMFGLDAFWSGK